MNACRRTIPEQSLEPVYNEAFLRAFRVTRASYGYFGIFSIAGTEIEMLELLTNEVLHREIIDDHLAISTAVRAYRNMYLRSQHTQLTMNYYNILIDFLQSRKEEKHVPKRSPGRAENSETNRPLELA